MKSFITNDGIELPIIPGFREQIKSNWKQGFKTFEYNNSTHMTLDKANKSKHDMHLALEILSKYGLSIKDKKILDVGCYTGIQCIAAIEQGASEAIGIDIPEYYINQSLDKNINASKILADRRQQIIDLFPNFDQNKIGFEDMSVFEMNYENEFDFIFSWETFEHITNPKEALKRIYRALKPGGISYNLYNPFFCISGGHSMCTLDYPFAHVLLENKDFKKYVENYKPPGVPENYAELSYDFYTKNLNRMTQKDLKNYIKEAGFKCIEFLNLPDMNLMKLIDNTILERAKLLYPNLTLKDLLSSYVYFIIKK